MLKITLEYIVYLNFIISISAGFLASGIANAFAFENYLNYGFFGFFSTLSVYNIQRLIKSKTDKKTPWLNWVHKHKVVVISISFISVILAGYFFIKILNKFTPVVFVLIAVAVLIAYYYVIRIGNKSIREMPYLKIHSIALTWTIVIILFPLVNEDALNRDILMYFIPAHYIYFIAIAIPFDIRDLKHDLLSQNTIPQIVGIKRAKIISILLLCLTIIGVGYFSSLLLKPLFLISFIIAIVLVAFTNENRHEYYFSILLDATIALLGLSYLTLNTLL